MGINEELASVRAKYDKDVREIKEKWAVLDKIGPVIEGYEQPMIHRYRLYGRVGSISIKAASYDSLRRGKDPDRALLATLLLAFPPEPVERVDEGGTISLRPAGNRDKLPEGLPVKIEPVGPVRVDIDNVDTTPTATFEWNAYLAGDLWAFQVGYRLHRTLLGALNTRARRWPDGQVSSWEVCEFTPSGGAHRIRWASGGPTYPNHFTLWWNAGHEVDYPSLVKEDQA